MAANEATGEEQGSAWRVEIAGNQQVSGRYLCTDLCTRRDGTGRDGGDADGRSGRARGVRRGQRGRRRPGETAETPAVWLITQRRQRSHPDWRVPNACQSGQS